ncbi:beta-lactamase-like protein [Crassisporium funariophilum]|nr:beta-lactamase-like protein [Crassisporium funariophilum]
MTSYTFTLPLKPSSTGSLPVTRPGVLPFAGASTTLPPAKTTHRHPLAPSSAAFPDLTPSHKRGSASLYFIGTATTILEWNGVRIMTDPNFLHDGDHVHLGPGVVGTRRTNPAVAELGDLPGVDVVLLSHYHADHFDEKVESTLRRDIPIITTPHAHTCLVDQKPRSEAFTAVHALDHWESGLLTIPPPSLSESPASSNDLSGRPAVRVTAMPGKHVPPGPLHILEKINDLLGAVPPVNGWMLELGSPTTNENFDVGYRIYTSGDTLLVSELQEIARRYTKMDKPIDLMLVHLGGTVIPSAGVPLVMVTMDAEQGIELIRLVKPDVTIPIHYDDYDVFSSPLDDFKKRVTEAGMDGKVVYLDRGDAYEFDVKSDRGRKIHASEQFLYTERYTWQFSNMLVALTELSNRIQLHQRIVLRVVMHCCNLITTLHNPLARLWVDYREAATRLQSGNFRDTCRIDLSSVN